ncbi:aldolase [Tothia fuscella]|uniref:Aldolase n=1 Tax=Tothia fuscella TaxID=1048955 RepID=A0A9P4NFK4_9PEZI|nr:aldolase [Tothia fuscella]
MVLLPVLPSMGTLHVDAPSAPHSLVKSRSVVDIRELLNGDKPALLLFYDEGEDGILGEVADVLGQDWTVARSRWEATREPLQTIVGVCASDIGTDWYPRDLSRTLISFRCVEGRRSPSHGPIGEFCDYEYLYSRAPFYRRDLARFLSFILGQTNPHRDLAKKSRTTLISTTYPDVHAALPNLEILSVGADAVELRVDLLKERLPDGTHSKLPSLEYVGEQLMLLRQRTELPIIYTTRCTNENGKFPMDDPNLFYQYLNQAIKWGCEYIDVELWLPEDIRRTLSNRKGSTKIISAFHDFSKTFRWTSPEAHELFKRGAVYGDVVKMIALVSTEQENYELEYFRSIIQQQYSHPPFSGLNMGRAGQLSRAHNKIFTPITHPLLPIIAAPGQLSAAEINQARHAIGEMPRLDFYGIGSYRSTVQAMFIEKCFNELSLPHHFLSIERAARDSVEDIIRRRNFGGAYINPPLPASAPYLRHLSDAARAIGQIDTIVVKNGNLEQAFVGENATWKGIRATLSRDFVPSAYSNRAALLLSNAESDAAAAIFALKSLGIGPIYTIGFKASGPLSSGVSAVRGVEDLKQLEHPFAIISALPADKSLGVVPLLRHYSGSGRQPGFTAGKVFVDLANGPRKGDPMAVASSLGWRTFGAADVSAWTTVERMRLLVGQNVPYDFVRLASGRGLD